MAGLTGVACILEFARVEYGEKSFGQGADLLRITISTTSLKIGIQAPSASVISATCLPMLCSSRRTLTVIKGSR
jgi:hypothetical protein